MRVLALGPIEVWAGDVEVSLGGRKPRALLAALLLQARQVVSVERLVSLIWDEDPPRSAVPLIHTYVSLLRRAFAAVGQPSIVLTRAPGYLLDIGRAASDLEMFEQWVDDARRAERKHDHDAAAELYRQALALWRGPALGGVDARFAQVRAAGLEEEQLNAEEGLARCQLARGRVAGVAERLATLAVDYPLREETRGLLMRALYRSGRQAEALAAYRDGRRQMLDELGIEPGEALRELHSAILTGTVEPLGGPEPHPVEPARRPAHQGVSETAAVPQRLPPDIGDFTGRAGQVETIVRLATRKDGRTATPTVVVSGFAGAGKSALAVHVAHLLQGSFPDGQLFADLRGTDRDLDAGEVLGRFLGALGVSGVDLPDAVDDRVELYRGLVAGRRLIIVLDNARSEQQVRRLLPGNPQCLVIITSRSRLTGLEGAEPVELDFFSTGASVEMITAILGQARVAAEPEAAAIIAHLCGGIPLALRVAAAKLLARPHWPLRRLADRLSDERHRLDELAIGDLAIRSSLRLNYAELDELHRHAFHLLTLLDLPDFGSWLAAPLLDVSVDDAEEIVERLVDLRLLDVVGVDSLGRVRYRFHDLVQLFGAERAGESEPAEAVEVAVSRALASWMALVEAGAERLPRVTLGLRPHMTTTVRLDPRLLEDVRADPTAWLKSETPAVVRAVERAHALGIDEMTTTLIASLLSSPFAARNEFDGWQRTHEVALKAARHSGNEAAEAVVLAGLGQLFYEKDDFTVALDHFQQAARHAMNVDDQATLAVALIGIGTVQRDLAEYAEARGNLARAAELGDQAGDASVVAAACYGIGAVARDHGDLDAADEQLRRSVELYQTVGDRRGEALALRGLGLCHRARGECDEAAELSQQALHILTDVGDLLGASYAAQSLAKADLRRGKFADARAMLTSCLETCVRHRDRFGEALMTRTLGELALAEGHLEQAGRLLMNSLSHWRELDLTLWQARTLRDLAAVAAASDPDAAAHHWTAALDLFSAAGAREHGELSATSPSGWLAHVTL
jgi:DNA-binding SARP family transcriptional activator